MENPSDPLKNYIMQLEMTVRASNARYCSYFALNTVTRLIRPVVVFRSKCTRGIPDITIEHMKNIM